MTQLIYVPIESLTERYTEQWRRRFPQAFESVGFEVLTIDGTPLLDNEIKVGAFLDINSSIYFKMSQLQEISRMFHNQEVKEGAVFFFGDVEFWGLESVRLMAQMNSVNIKMAGFLHAASYTREDAFSVAAPYQKYTEVGWIAALDKVFIGSRYHKEQVEGLRLFPVADSRVEYQELSRKIVVTKNPVFIDEYPIMGLSKEKTVLLTNRLDKEKRPYDTLKLFEKLKAKHPDWTFKITSGRPTLRGDLETVAFAKELEARGVIEVLVGITKWQYHEELSKAFMVVSHSIEENYGYCIAEAIYYGAIPLLRAGLSHSEFVNDPMLLFTTDEDAEKAAGFIMSSWDTDPLKYQVAELDTNGLTRIVNELKCLSKPIASLR